MSKWNSRHVVIGCLVLIGLFCLRWIGIEATEVTLWYDALKWITGVIVFGHAANKFVDNKKE